MREIDKERMKRMGLKEAEFKPAKKPVESYITDEHGNKYKQAIKDGQIALELVEDYTGMCYM